MGGTFRRIWTDNITITLQSPLTAVLVKIIKIIATILMLYATEIIRIIAKILIMHDHQLLEIIAVAYWHYCNDTYAV